MQVQVLRGTRGKVAFYDAAQATKEHRGWALGHFITGTDGEPLTTEFEVKLSSYDAGDCRNEWSKGPAGSAINIVLSGKQEFTIAPDGEDGQTITRVLAKGDAIFWENRVPHKWRIIEDAEIVGVRRLA